MKQLIGQFTVCLALFLPTTGFSGSQDVVVDQPWSRASIGTMRPGVAYMTIRNTGDAPVTLIGLRTDVAMMPQIHRSVTNADGISSMSPAGDIVIVPGASVALAPGGLHAMLMKLQGPLIEGTTYRLVLVLEDGSEVAFEVPVIGVAARGPER